MSLTKAAIIIIGDEVLSGFTRDKNFSYLSGRLWELGIEVVLAMGVRDRDEDIKKALHLAAKEWGPKYIITTGGLGITHDDITVESIAKALKLPLIESEEAKGLSLEALKRLGEDVGDDVLRRLSKIPEGFRPLLNPVGVAPGLWGDVRMYGEERSIIVLPGVPAEVEGIFERWVRSEIVERGGCEPKAVEEIVVVGRESEIHSILKNVQRMFSGVKIGSYPRGPREVLLRIVGDKEVVERCSEALRKHLFEAGVELQ